VKFKPLALTASLLLASSLVFAAPEAEQAAAVKRGSELVNLMQLGDQVKSSVSERTDQMLGKAMSLLGVPYKLSLIHI
jgi:hypothetical protein